MATGVNIEFDEASLGILKKVDGIHRNSLINVGLALVSKTGYYKTLAGIGPEELAEVAGLNELDKVLEESSENPTETKKDSPTWGSDDDFFS